MTQQVETLSELLNRWKSIHTIYRTMAKRDWGEDSPQKNQVASVMVNQLGRCIADLERVMYGDVRRRELSKIIKETFGG